jgi:hypothetical protein
MALPHAKRIRWQAVALLATSLSLLLTCVVLFGVMHPPRLPGEPTDPHAVPLDLANYELRKALDEYAMFTLGRGLESIADRCDGQREIYRVVTLPGLGGDSRFVAVDFEVSGSTAAVKTLMFNEGATGQYAWHVASRRTVGEKDIEATRDAAGTLLLSGIPAAIEDAYIDAPDWIVETCRNDRYHFFRRRAPVSTRAEHESLVTFVRAMRAFDAPLRN